MAAGRPCARVADVEWLMRILTITIAPIGTCRIAGDYVLVVMRYNACQPICNARAGNAAKYRGARRGHSIDNDSVLRWGPVVGVAYTPKSRIRKSG